MTARNNPMGRLLRLEALEERTLLSANPGALLVPNPLGGPGSDVQASSPNSTYFSPPAITTGYGDNNIYFGTAAGNGAGQTIAIVDAYNDPNIAGDLTGFDAQYGLPAPPSFQVVSQTGSTTSLPPTDPEGTDPGRDNWELEESLDVEWAHAVAPGANIVLVEANNNSFSDLFTAVSEAASLGTVVSMSWGGSESSGETSDDSTYFSASGVTYLAATGDASVGGYPAFSPNVVAVGGTDLTVNSSTNAYQSETAWSDSGRGVSAYESDPTYQSTYWTAQGDPSSAYREIPDIVADADSPVWIDDSFENTNGNGNWIAVIGTSLSTPIWAGLVAIADQGRTAAGDATLSGSTETLPALYSLPSTDFHKITSSTYDDVTGLGSPIANLVIPGLVGDGTVGTATELTVAAQPPASMAPGAGFGLTVVAEDAAGTMDPTYNGSVTISLANNPGGSTLGGTLTATAVDGVTTFSNLTLSQSGTGYTLQAAASGLSSATTSSFNVLAPAPAVTASGTTNMFRDGGSAVAVDAAVMVSSSDADLSGATVTISAGTLQSGDTLNFTNQNGISGNYSGGVLTLSGSATPAQYQTALQSVTFSTTSTVTTTRSISIVAIDGALDSSPATESVKVAVAAPVVTASGTTITYTVNGSALAVDSGATVTSSDTNLSGATVVIADNTLQSGDALNFTNQSGISGNYSGGVLSLSGTATIAQYQTALRSVTFSTSGSNTTTRTISIVAIDGGALYGALNSAPAAESVKVSTTALTLTPSGTTSTFLVSGAPVPVDSGLTASPSGSDLTGATVTISNYQSGDSLDFTNQNGINGGYASGVLTLSGVATVAQYQTALQSVTFSTTSANTAVRSLSIVAIDGSLESNTATKHVNLLTTVLALTPSGTTNTFTVGGAAFAVDAGVAVSAYDANLSGGTVTIGTGYQSADALQFTNQNGISGAYSGGVLTLSGSATPAQYQTALQSVTFSTTSANTTTREISIVAFAGALTSNSAAEQVGVSTTLPVLTPSGTTNTVTVGGAAVAVDAGLTGSPSSSDLTGATVAVSAGTLQSGDTLNFINQNGISGSYAAGVLSLTGIATVSQYVTALESVTFSTTTAVTTARSLSIVANDGSLESSPAVESVSVAIAAPVVATSWAISFDGTNGANPGGNLTLSTDGSTFYGMTEHGGANALGTIFSIPVTGGAPTTLLSFNGTDGSDPFSSLTLSSDGSTLYGMTYSGGAHSEGTIFSIPVTGGTPTTLLSFNGTDGGSPVGSLTLSGSTLYGMTLTGGVNNEGTVFSIPVTGGTPTTLLSFNGTNGEDPHGDLTLSGSTLYGMTVFGGANNSGTIFSIPVTGGTPTTLLSFNQTTGGPPLGSLTLSGSTLYGTTGEGGANGDGTVFSIPVTGGTLTTLLTFNGTNGEEPRGDLTVSGSTLYGTTASGGANSDGTVFSIPLTGGTPTTLLSFNGTDGTDPWGSLTFSGSTLYGTTYSGGAGGDGTVFSLNPPNTFTLGSPAAAVDSGVTVASYDTDITGASETIANYQSGDALNFTNQNGISGSYFAGVLTLSGSATPAQYQAALQSVTFSTTSLNTTTRTVDIVADDSSASPTTGNTGADTVNVAIAAPLVTANQASVDATAGQTVSVDSAVTVSSFDTLVTGATMTIGTGYQSGSDTLNFTNQNGISGSYAGGVLTLSGSASPVQYQAALQSVTFSSTSISTATRNISIVVSDSNDTGDASSNTATTQIAVSAPITITGAYVAGSNWTTPSFANSTAQFDSYLVSNGLGDATVPTVGYALQTGSAQLTTLPWANVNTISVSFSGAVSNIGLGSLELVGGNGGGAVAAPSATGFTSDGSNTYSWSLSGNLGNNKYIFAIATTGSSFGTSGSTQVVDGNGAGISGHFVTSSSSFPSGNGLAGSTFDFAFNVLPGDGNQNALVNTSDGAGAKALNNDHETSAAYNPYFDYNGAGIINSTDPALDATDVNTKQSGITAPTAPSATNVGVGSSSFTALALGVPETGSSSSSSSSTSTVSNVVSTGANSIGTVPASTTSTSTTATTTLGHHGRHEFAVVDEALSDFDLADLYV